MKTDALLSLLHVADPNLPIGGYSHSNGLETYVQNDMVTDKESALEFLQNMLHNNILHNDAAYVKLVYDAMQAKDFKKVMTLDAGLTALKSPREIREGSHKLGARLLKIFKTKNNHPDLLKLDKYLSENKEVGNYAIVYGVVCFASNISLKEALSAFYFSTAAGMITNAVKLVPLGQLQGQEILFTIQEGIGELVDKTLNLDESLIGIANVGFDLRSMQHEKLHSRLYMS
ncbi:urease accessory protein UreF [Oceanihabitans sp. IOP_32]|uniref:urease accessory protein UreF n=1 Tax=Oceanihabitans sp. IOP_32 TaxID=2529032 RepID=UPI001293BEEA|nr:urease accessory protein UreF [Oceanihabitans sp. IOP_32]QFZ55308.1 urease accessory protein UreF [Oceanihabitans sp. IOP_32]